MLIQMKHGQISSHEQSATVTTAGLSLDVCDRRARLVVILVTRAKVREDEVLEPGVFREGSDGASASQGCRSAWQERTRRKQVPVAAFQTASEPVRALPT